MTVNCLGLFKCWFGGNFPYLHDFGYYYSCSSLTAVRVKSSRVSSPSNQSMQAFPLSVIEFHLIKQYGCSLATSSSDLLEFKLSRSPPSVFAPVLHFEGGLSPLSLAVWYHLVAHSSLWVGEMYFYHSQSIHIWKVIGYALVSWATIESSTLLTTFGILLPCDLMRELIPLDERGEGLGQVQMKSLMFCEATIIIIV